MDTKWSRKYSWRPVVHDKIMGLTFWIMRMRNWVTFPNPHPPKTERRRGKKKKKMETSFPRIRSNFRRINSRFTVRDQRVFFIFIFLYIVFPLPNVPIAIAALALVRSNVLLCCASSSCSRPNQVAMNLRNLLWWVRLLEKNWYNVNVQEWTRAS